MESRSITPFSDSDESVDFSWEFNAPLPPIVIVCDDDDTPFELPVIMDPDQLTPLSDVSADTPAVVALTPDPLEPIQLAF